MKFSRSVARLAAQASCRPGGFVLEELEADPADGIYILLARLDRAREQYSELEEQKELLTGTVAAQDAQLAAKVVDTQRLEHELDSLRAAMEKSAGSAGRLADFAEVTQELAVRLEEVRNRLPQDDPIEELDRLANSNAELDEALGECRLMIAQLQQQPQNGLPVDMPQRTNGADTQRLLHAKLADLAGTRTMLARREAELDVTNQKLDTAQRRNDELRRRLDEQQRDGDRLQERLDRLLAGQHKSASGEAADPVLLESLRDQLRESTRERADLRESLERSTTIQAELSRVRDELTRTRQYSSAMEQTHRATAESERQQQRKQIGSLEQQAAELTVENNQLRLEAEELIRARKRIFQLENERLGYKQALQQQQAGPSPEATEEYDQVVRRVGQLEAERETLGEQVERIRQQLEVSRGRESSLEEELRAERAACLASEATRQEHERHIERERLSQDNLKTEVERVALRNETLQADRDGLRSELELTTGKLDKTQSDRAGLLEELGQERLRQDQLTSERRQLERQVSQYSSQLQQLESQSEQVTELLARLQEHLGTELSGGTLSELAAELYHSVEGRFSGLEEELVRERSERENLQHDSDADKGQIVELESALREVGGERERLERRLGEREQDFEDRSGQMMSDHQRELSTLSADFDQLSQRYQEVCDGFKNFHDTRRNEREQLRLDLEEKSEVLEATNLKMAELENQLVTAEVIRGEKLVQREEQVAELRALLEEARVELGERQTERERLLRSQEDAQRQIDVVRQEVADHLAELEAHRDSAEQEAAQLQARLGEVEQTRTAETQGMRQQLTDREERLSQLTQELASTRTRMNEIESRVRSQLDEAARRERQLEQALTQFEHDLTVLNTAFGQRGERIEGLESELDEVVRENEQLTAVSTAPALVNGQQLADQIKQINLAMGEFVQRERTDRSQLEQALGNIGSQVEKLTQREEAAPARRRRQAGRTFSAVTPAEEMRDTAVRERAPRQPVDEKAENDLAATLERLRSLQGGKKS